MDQCYRGTLIPRSSRTVYRLNTMNKKKLVVLFQTSSKEIGVIQNQIQR